MDFAFSFLAIAQNTSRFLENDFDIHVGKLFYHLSNLILMIPLNVLYTNIAEEEMNNHFFFPR